MAAAALRLVPVAIDVWHYQTATWELDLSYYRDGGLVGRRDQLPSSLLSASVPARLVRGLLRRQGVRASREATQQAQQAAAQLCGVATEQGRHWADAPARRPVLAVSILPGCQHFMPECAPREVTSRAWETVRTRIAGVKPVLYHSSASLVQKGVSIFGLTSSLAEQLPDYVLTRYAAHRERLRAEEAAEVAAKVAEAKANPNLRHPPTLGSAYRDATITEQAQKYVYERLPLRVACGVATGGGIAGLASLSAAGTRKLTSMGPLRFFGGLAAMGGAVGLMVDFTTRAGYEDAFMDAGETPPHETPWFIKPNKTFARAQATSPQCDCQGFF